MLRAVRFAARPDDSLVDPCERRRTTAASARPGFAWSLRRKWLETCRRGPENLSGMTAGVPKVSGALEAGVGIEPA